MCLGGTDFIWNRAQKTPFLRASLKTRDFDGGQIRGYFVSSLILAATNDKAKNLEA